MINRACLILLCFAFVDDSYATSKLSVNMKLGHWGGHTMYQIGGPAQFGGESVRLPMPISELKFPLFVKTAGIRAKLRLNRRWRMHVNWETNLSDFGGYMIDQDWGVDYLSGDELASPDRLDIKSESASYVNAHFLDVTFDRRLRRINKWLVLGGVGLKRTSYHFTIRRIHQWYPSDPALEHDYIEGVGLKYNIISYAPYGELSFIPLSQQRYRVALALRYSPYVMIDDRDDHVLRDKVSRGKLVGDMRSLLLKAHYALVQHLYLFFDAEANWVYADGVQHQQGSLDDAQWEAELEQKHESFVYQMSAGIKLTF